MAHVGGDFEADRIYVPTRSAVSLSGVKATQLFVETPFCSSNINEHRCEHVQTHPAPESWGRRQGRCVLVNGSSRRCPNSPLDGGKRRIHQARIREQPRAHHLERVRRQAPVFKDLFWPASRKVTSRRWS